MEKKLYRVEHGKKMSGVCAGLAQYFNMDVTVMRLLWVIGTLLTAFWVGLILYVACVFIIPVEPDFIDGEYEEKE